MKNVSSTRRAMVLTALLFVSTMVWSQVAEPIVLGHRGGRTEQDENTLSAFENAWKAGIHSFETDIHQSKDGVLVVSHDSSLKRMCGIDGVIEQMTAAELREVKTLQGHPLLFFDDLLAFFSGKQGLYVELEMKTSDAKLYPDDAIAGYCEKAYKAIRKKIPADADWSMTSFDYRPLRYLREHHPDATLALISGQPCCDQTIEVAKALGVQRLAVTLDGSTRAALSKAHKAGLKVNLWPGSKVEDTLLAIWLGADFCCTDIPIEVKKFLDGKMPWLRVKY
ncbi:MAG: glycerophosphodiester phosphodiesterase [Prevotella sp.]|nr:glycerophosphodiester phosphodiesterase [Prevotella sp.]